MTWKQGKEYLDVRDYLHVQKLEGSVASLKTWKNPNVENDCNNGVKTEQPLLDTSEGVCFHPTSIAMLH